MISMVFVVVGTILKALFFLLILYIAYHFVLTCIEAVWSMIHPKSLAWFKSKVSDYKKKKVTK